MQSFTIEWGAGFNPPIAEMTNIIEEITCGLLAFCMELCAKENAMAWQTKGNGATNPTTDFLGTADNEPVVIKANGSEALRITSAGDVGIGFATPGAKLHVNGGAMISGVAIGKDITGVNYSYEYETVGVSDHQYNLRLQSPNDIFLHTGSPIPTARLTIDANGNVGIGTPTQPLSKLYVEDNSSTFALVILQPWRPGPHYCRLWRHSTLGPLRVERRGHPASQDWLSKLARPALA